jgi:hypothetical protein
MSEITTVEAITTERLDQLIAIAEHERLWTVFNSEIRDTLREFRALRERVAMLDARDPPNIYTEYMGLTALSPKLIKDGFDWRDNRINEFLAAASQASFCLREKLPNDVDAKLSVRMLEDARLNVTRRT